MIRKAIELAKSSTQWIEQVKKGAGESAEEKKAALYQMFIGHFQRSLIAHIAHLKALVQDDSRAGRARLKAYLDLRKFPLTDDFLWKNQIMEFVASEEIKEILSGHH